MINILVAANRPYLQGIKVLFYSLKETQKEDFTVYFVCYKDKPLEEEVLSFSRTIGVNCKIIQVPDKVQKTFEKMYSVHHLLRITIECFYRILSPVILPKDMNRVLWLDTDIVVTKDLSDFYHQDFEGNYICAAHGFGNPVVMNNLFHGHPELVNPKEIRPHRNDEMEIKSSVVIFNLDLLREVPTFKIDKICDILLAEAPLWWCDQTLLSTLCYGAIKYFDKNKVAPDIVIGVKFYEELFGLEEACNLVMVNEQNPKRKREMLKQRLALFYTWRYVENDGLMIHYTNTTKPWEPYIRKVVQGDNNADNQTWYECEERMNKFLETVKNKNKIFSSLTSMRESIKNLL